MRWCAPGRHIAVIGRGGAGKTTVARGAGRSRTCRSSTLIGCTGTPGWRAVEREV